VVTARGPSSPGHNLDGRPTGRGREGTARHLGTGAAGGPTSSFGIVQGESRRAMRHVAALCLKRRRRGAEWWNELDARRSGRRGDGPKPSIAAGALGSDVTSALPQPKLGGRARTEGIVEDVEPSDGSA
jgi:hypothetical protein